MTKYGKKPVVVDAEVYREGMEDGWLHVLEKFIEVDPRQIAEQKEAGIEMVPVILTIEGYHVVSPGDYIITGVKGERYPCKPDIFNATYELVEGDEE